MTPIDYLPTPYSYSSAVKAGDYIFVGLHRGFGGDFLAQLDGALKGVSATLDHFGLPLFNLVQVKVWLKNVKDLPEMEKAFTRYFAPDHFPARMTATTEFIDDDCLVMIEGTAYCGS